MRKISISMKKILAKIARCKLIRLFALTILILLLGASGLSFFEKPQNVIDAFWWSFVTITTVGYGDIAPLTVGGRITGIVVMVFGIGILGMFTATIASAFVEGKLKEGKGVKAVKVKDHFLICCWSYKVKEIIAELRADQKVKGKPIVLIADIPENPLEDENTYFIHGEINEETLKKAGLQDASVVMILSDEDLDSYSRDAKVILNTLTIRTQNPNVYICVEISDAKNMQHGKMAGADEIIVIGELSSNLLVQASLDHGITQVITELVSNRFGTELYKIKPPQSLIGKQFIEVLTVLKKEHNAIALAIESPKEKKIITNPSLEYIIQPEDHLVLVAQERPDFGRQKK